MRSAPDKTIFLKQSGLNLPWITYGRDVGWPHVPGTHHLVGFRHLQKVLSRKARLPVGMKTLRVWMLGDDRAGLFGPADHPGFTARCIRDLDEFMKATPQDLAVIWVIFDFMIGDGVGSRWGGKAGEAVGLVHTETGLQRSFEIIEPCVREIQKRHGRRIIWDVINEPLNGRRLVCTDEHMARLKRFVRHYMVNLLRMRARVTFGARSLAALRNVFKDVIGQVDEVRRSIGLAPDHLVIQFHHYPGSELHRDSSLRTFTASGLRSELGLDEHTPVILGEAWTGSGFTLADYFAMGFSGVLFWQDSKMGPSGPAASAQVRAFLGAKKALWPAEPASAAPPKQVTGPEPRHRSGKATPKRVSKTMEVPLGNCRILSTGPPSEKAWLKKLGYRAEAFVAAELRPSKGLDLRMEVRADADMRTVPYWKQHRRHGEVVCSPGVVPAYDFTRTDIEVRLVPPIRAVADRWGSGAQILLEDDSGRRMLGAWNSFSAVSGGGEHVLRFRPPLTAVPGMGFRHPGFDLTRVSRVGLLWAVATFATVRYRAVMTLRSIKVSEVRGPAGPDHVQPETAPVRPARPLPLHRCRFRPLAFLYLQGATVSVPGPNDTATVELNLDPSDPFRRAGGVVTDLATACPSTKGRVVDLSGALLRVSVSSVPGSLVRYQVFVTDQSGTSCYSRLSAPVGKGLDVNLDRGPSVCSHGAGVDFGRIRSVGVKFFLPAGHSRRASGMAKIDELIVGPVVHGARAGRKRGRFFGRLRMFSRYFPSIGTGHSIRPGGKG